MCGGGDEGGLCLRVGWASGAWGGGVVGWLKISTLDPKGASRSPGKQQQQQQRRQQQQHALEEAVTIKHIRWGGGLWTKLPKSNS